MAEIARSSPFKVEIVLGAVYPGHPALSERRSSSILREELGALYCVVSSLKGRSGEPRAERSASHPGCAGARQGTRIHVHLPSPIVKSEDPTLIPSFRSPTALGCGIQLHAARLSASPISNFPSPIVAQPKDFSVFANNETATRMCPTQWRRSRGPALSRLRSFLARSASHPGCAGARQGSRLHVHLSSPIVKSEDPTPIPFAGGRTWRGSSGRTRPRSSRFPRRTA